MYYPPAPPSAHPTPEAARLQHLVTALTAILPLTLRTLATLDHSLAQLETQPRTDAAIYWRQKKYMVLVHPVLPDGSRQREYIGLDPARQQAAQAAISLYQQWRQALSAQAAYLARICQANDALNAALKTLQDRPQGW